MPLAVAKRAPPPKPIRKEGEWQRVELSKLDPALRTAFQQLCAAAATATATTKGEDASICGPVQPMEEYDVLRALKARKLNLPRTLERLHSHRQWWKENQPREKRLIMQGDAGVVVRFAVETWEPQRVVSSVAAADPGVLLARSVCFPLLPRSEDP